MSEIRETWNARADLWAAQARDARDYWTRRQQAVQTTILRHIGKGRAVDVGCGPGLLCRLLAQAGFDVHGADLSENMLAKARDLLSDCIPDAAGRLHLCPEGRLPFDLPRKTGLTSSPPSSYWSTSRTGRTTFGSCPPS